MRANLTFFLFKLIFKKMETRKMPSPFQNTQHAYYTALVLSLTTEDDAYRQECISMAAAFSTKLSEDQQQECKDKIIAILQKGDFYTDNECVEKVNSIHGTSTIATGGFLNAKN